MDLEKRVLSNGVECRKMRTARCAHSCPIAKRKEPCERDGCGARCAPGGYIPFSPDPGLASDRSTTVDRCGRTDSVVVDLRTVANGMYSTARRNAGFGRHGDVFYFVDRLRALLRTVALIRALACASSMHSSPSIIFVTICTAKQMTGPPEVSLGTLCTHKRISAAP